jgi:hypothetical protein
MVSASTLLALTLPAPAATAVAGQLSANLSGPFALAPSSGFLAWSGAGSGSVRATFLQVGEHSHSNISKGPFAPSPLAAEDEIPEGSNYWAMSK